MINHHHLSLPNPFQPTTHQPPSSSSFSLWSPTNPIDISFFTNDDFFLPDNPDPLTPHFVVDDHQHHHQLSECQSRIRKTSLSAAWADLQDNSIENGFTSRKRKVSFSSSLTWHLFDSSTLHHHNHQPTSSSSSSSSYSSSTSCPSSHSCQVDHDRYLLTHQYNQSQDYFLYPASDVGSSLLNKETTESNTLCTVEKQGTIEHTPIPHSYSSLVENFPLIPPTVALNKTSPDIYLTVVHAVPVFVTMCPIQCTSTDTRTGLVHASESNNPRPNPPLVFLLRRADKSQFVNATSLLIAGGIESDKERSIILSLERGRVLIHDTKPRLKQHDDLNLVGTWIPLSRAQALATTCALDSILIDFLAPDLPNKFPSLPPMTVPPSLQIHWQDDDQCQWCSTCHSPQPISPIGSAKPDMETVAPASTIRSASPLPVKGQKQALPRTGSSFATLSQQQQAEIRVNPDVPVKLKPPTKRKKNADKDLVLTQATSGHAPPPLTSPIARDQMHKRKYGHRPKVVGVPAPHSFYADVRPQFPAQPASLRPVLSSSSMTGGPTQSSKGPHGGGRKPLKRPKHDDLIQNQPLVMNEVPAYVETHGLVKEEKEDNDATEDEETQSESEIELNPPIVGQSSDVLDIGRNTDCIETNTGHQPIRVFQRTVMPVPATGRSLPVVVTEVQFDSNDSNFTAESSLSPQSSSNYDDVVFDSDSSLDIVTPFNPKPRGRPITTYTPLRSSSSLVVVPMSPGTDLKLSTITPPPTPILGLDAANANPANRNGTSTRALPTGTGSVAPSRITRSAVRPGTIRSKLKRKLPPAPISVIDHHHHPHQAIIISPRSPVLLPPLPVDRRTAKRVTGADILNMLLTSSSSDDDSDTD